MQLTEPQSTAASSYTLGLDLGTASLGWAVVDGLSQRVLDAGVRIFEPAVDATKFERGQEGASKNVARRTARLQRRQFRRRAARHHDLFLELQEAGLLPPTPDPKPADRGEARQAVLGQLDAQLRAAWRERLAELQPACPAPEQTLLYALRARALDARLEPHELGRALYHLAQRRGFKSNRRASKREPGKDGEKEESELKQEMAALEREIQESGSRTLGEFLSRQDPAAARIRGRHAQRRLYEEEFDGIWNRQAEWHAVLTPELRERVHNLIFFQRPIKAPPPGRCELETGCFRAPMASLPAQRFRLLQKVNDLRILDGRGERALTPEQRTTLLAELEKGDVTFGAARKLLGLRGTRFNLESERQDKIEGNRTGAKMLAAFGERWMAFSEAERDRIVELWRQTEDEAELKQVGQQYGLEAEAAEAWARPEAGPEDGYCRLSVEALRKLLPRMEAGAAFKTAETEVYGARFSGGAVRAQLDPVAKVLAHVPNPAVMRSLTELRKVVNAVVRQFGKPHEIRIELARDLKRSARDRDALSRAMSQQQKARGAAKGEIVKELGIQRPSGADIEKALLFEECGGLCPYSGEPIDFRALFETGEFEVEHILPKTRFFDDSFANKTLCHRSMNAQKRDRTPFEAFGHDPEQWEQILERVRKFKRLGAVHRLGKRKGKRAELEPRHPKLGRFLLTSADELESFSNRQLSDTRYASKLAARYLEQLYGGRDVEQADGRKRQAIFASAGPATATLRRAWGLEAILRQPEASANGQSKGKPRTDHRHHAVDAVVIALTSRAAVQQLAASAEASQRQTGVARVSSRTLEAPWPDFVESVRPVIERINVSHRPERKLSGEPHDQTLYGRPRQSGEREWAHVRKSVHTLSEKQIRAADVIVDPRVRDAVRAKLEELGDPKKLEQDPACLVTRRGKRVKILKVRIRVPCEVRKIGAPPRERYVWLRSNHHMGVFAGRDAKGREVWDYIVVSRLDAFERRRSGQPVVQKDLPGQPDFQFLFSLMSGDMVEIEDNDGRRGLFVVRSISKGDFNFARHTCAMLKEDMAKTRHWLRIRSIEKLRQRGCRKVSVDPLGRVREAND